MRSRAVARRTTTLASSLPTVVGLAVWPWVRLNIGTAAYACAISRSLPITPSSRGQQRTCSRAYVELQRGISSVVDVLAGAGEVHELAGRAQLGPGFELRLDPVLDRLDVVVGGFFDLLDGHGIGHREILDQPEQVGARPGRQGLEFGEVRIAQCDEPADFHLHATVHVALLAHQRAQRGQPTGVAAIERREGRYRGKCHGGTVGALDPGSGARLVAGERHARGVALPPRNEIQPLSPPELEDG